MGKKLCLLLLVAMSLTMLSACGKPRVIPTIEVEVAQLDVDDYCRGYETHKDTDRKFILDLNGDGAEEVCTNVAHGAELTRTDVVVYDIFNNAYYTLADEFIDYKIDSIENDRLVVVEDNQTVGTVKIDGDQLVFVADKKSR